MNPLNNLGLGSLKMLSPTRTRRFSESMDYDDELAELEDKRVREMRRLSLPGTGHSHSHTHNAHSHSQPLLPIPLPLLHQPQPLPPQQESDEDTEDASEDGDFLRPSNLSKDPHAVQEEHQNIKEQVYFDKLNLLKGHLEELAGGNHNEYSRGLEKLNQDYKDRLEMNVGWFEYELSCIERDFQKEQRTIGREFEDKKNELRETIISELEEKRKQVEMDRYAMELSVDPLEVKPMVTRKLRRRPNDPLPLPERRKKTTQSALTFLLDERELEEDLKAMHNPSAQAFLKASSKAGRKHEDYMESHQDSRIEDGKLFYEKRWFHRGQPVYVEGSSMPKVSGVISSISGDLVWVRKINEQSKIRVPISALQKGKLFIKRRAN